MNTFKIGDKVKISGHFYGTVPDPWEGIIVENYKGRGTLYIVEVKRPLYYTTNLSFSSTCLTPALKTGQQLQFRFMDVN